MRGQERGPDRADGSIDELDALIARRSRRGRPRGPCPYEADLGVLTDAEIAAKWGARASSVYAARRLRGIARVGEVRLEDLVVGMADNHGEEWPDALSIPSPLSCPACLAPPGAPCVVVPGARLRDGVHPARRPPKGARGRRAIGVCVEVRIPVDVHARAVAEAERRGCAVAVVLREAVARGMGDLR